VDFSTLVLQLTQEGRLQFPQSEAEPSKVTYHDSCHLKRTIHASEAPRQLLKLAGCEIHEMAESDVCCGMGGSYSLKLPAVSRAVLQRKLTNIRATGASEVSADCPGCVLQIRGGCDAGGLGVAVKHTAERLAERLEPAR
jgi:Fe-S oxidoreductase